MNVYHEHGLLTKRYFKCSNLQHIVLQTMRPVRLPARVPAMTNRIWTVSWLMTPTTSVQNGPWRRYNTAGSSVVIVQVGEGEGECYTCFVTDAQIFPLSHPPFSYMSLSLYPHLSLSLSLSSHSLSLSSICQSFKLYE